MSAYTRQLHCLQDAIMGGDTAPLLALLSPARAQEISPHTRLDAYRGSYIERLIGATLADYPALEQYVGTAPLREAARAYAWEHPSRHWDLNLYPIPFAAYFAARCASMEAAALAALESAVAEVYWREESDPLDAAFLARMEMETLAAQHFALRSACMLLRQAARANDYLNAFRAGHPPKSILHGAEYVCVVRHENEVRRVDLDAAEYTILHALEKGAAFGEALECAAAECDAGELIAALPSYLTRWLQYGILCAR